MNGTYRNNQTGELAEVYLQIYDVFPNRTGCRRVLKTTSGWSKTLYGDDLSNWTLIEETVTSKRPTKGATK